MNQPMTDTLITDSYKFYVAEIESNARKFEQVLRENERLRNEAFERYRASKPPKKSFLSFLYPKSTAPA